MISFNKNTLRVLTMGLFLMILTISCTQIIDSNELFKNETILKFNNHKSDTCFLDNSVDLEINSPKVKELRNWIDNNKTDWKNSIASYAQPSISLIGNDFSMLIFKDFVVIGFTDKNNKPRQITKQTDYKDFEFLIEDKK